MVQLGRWGTGLEEATIGYNTAETGEEISKHFEFYWRLRGQISKYELILEHMFILRELQQGYRFDNRQHSQPSLARVAEYCDKFFPVQ